jgi:phosphoglycolate phosphatase
MAIVDVDNTLFDWVRAWGFAVRPMLERLAALTGWSRDRAEREVARVHASWAATECPACLMALDYAWPDAARASVVEGYEADFLAAGPLYDDTIPTLAAVRGAGALVVAYTESPAAFTSRRLSLLGLDGLTDAVYARGDVDGWQPCAPWNAGRSIVTVGRPELKPEPAALHRILEEHQVAHDRALYIGDNLWKDVQMANRAGVHAAWARYGTVRQREDEELLQRLCHWSPEASERERRSGKVARPDAILQRLGDVLDRFTFTAPS